MFTELKERMIKEVKEDMITTLLQIENASWVLWLTPDIPALWEAEDC